jgi:hypothetical protein
MNSALVRAAYGMPTSTLRHTGASIICSQFSEGRGLTSFVLLVAGAIKSAIPFGGNKVTVVLIKEALGF